MSVDHSQMRLGKAQPRHDDRTLRLSRYLTSDLVAPPRIDWAAPVKSWPMLRNDELGDCTAAAAGHLIHAWSANNGAPVVLSDQQVVDAYSAITGYDPSDPSTDQGAVELDVLNYWKRTGIAGHKIAGYVALSPRNREHIALSIDLLGGCYLGVALPVSAQTQEVWDVPEGGAVGDGAPASWGLHAVPALNYGPAGITIVTWGQLKTLTWSFFDAYVDEAYGVLSAADWAQGGTKTAPSGFNLAQLQEDLRAIAG